MLLANGLLALTIVIKGAICQLMASRLRVGERHHPLLPVTEAAWAARWPASGGGTQQLEIVSSSE
jgi:hypothetical protein